MSRSWLHRSTHENQPWNLRHIRRSFRRIHNHDANERGIDGGNRRAVHDGARTLIDAASPVANVRNAIVRARAFEPLEPWPAWPQRGDFRRMDSTLLPRRRFRLIVRAVARLQIPDLLRSVPRVRCR